MSYAALQSYQYAQVFFISDFKPHRSKRRNRNRKNKHIRLLHVNVGRVDKD